MNSDRHRHWTGVGNRRILSNLEALAGTGAEIQIRIPLIKGVNCDEENIEATASFVAALPGLRKSICLLPYHKLAEGKSIKLGQEYNAASMTEPGEEEITGVISRFADHGLEAKVGG